MTGSRREEREKRKKEQGKRKEEKGKRNEERGTRKEERGKRKLKKVLSVTKHGSFSEPSVNQTLNLRSTKRFRIA